MLSIIRACIVKQSKSIALLSGITAASFSTMAAAEGVDFHKLSTETKLLTLPDGPEIDARDLWKDSGAVVQIVRRPGWKLCREEAVWLSSKASQLGNVKLVAVVKENLDTEVDDFRQFIKSDIYLDEAMHFYGPKIRKGGYMSLLSPSLISKLNAIKLPNNLKGEGWIMGGVLVVGPGDQGILYEHLEAKVGDRCDADQVMAAVAKISTE